MIHPMDWLRKTKWTIRQEIIWDRLIAATLEVGVSGRLRKEFTGCTNQLVNTTLEKS